MSFQPDVEIETFYLEASQIAEYRPGFEEFLKLYDHRGGWPREMVSGTKYFKLLEIKGREDTAA